MSGEVRQKKLEEIAVETGEDEPQVMGSTRVDRSDMNRMGKIQELKVCVLPMANSKCRDELSHLSLTAKPPTIVRPQFLCRPAGYLGISINASL